ncbi:bifunctional phosphoribosylaminoimidazolecarboxamide formyltransferase/IMP cyclohydrolase [Tersicoccus sp. MR15.9]|uniref:bifunctional phosphoribosylaminoimidazolecarboxamide formyltransferase/IMP cyclohydrolase n=1 Tax=Tersicoccus mangrovi TaxID=3121635 RepID=UPI002FE69D9F
MSLQQLDRVPLHRALISVYDKTGLTELAVGLHAAGVSIVSTGSTAKAIAAAGVPVTEVADVTGFPETLDGRVKTLHPRVHAGILADRRKPEHVAQLHELEVEPFDLVIVNLYPFVDTVASGAAADEIVEQIDIGGPSMVRAAAKNHASVAVVVDPSGYPEVVHAAEAGGFDLAARRRLAARAFAHTASYDNAVATWTAGQFLDEDENGTVSWPAYAGLALERSEVLRYGENPHQQAALYADKAAPAGIAQADQLHGKAMSYNNFVDADAALRAAFDFDSPAVAIIKHANPCGIAVGSPDAEDPIADAHRKAHACDPVSAYGGVVAANRVVTAGMATTLKDIFTEVVIAPGFEPGALTILTAKKNIRLLALPEGFGRYPAEIRQVSGGVLVQVTDRLDAEGDDPATWTLVAGEPADEKTLADLAFAWRACRAAKSNAILLARDGASIGVGMGQVNRVDSCRLAVERARELAPEGPDGTRVDRVTGSVAASDAFFPFADGAQILFDAGVSAVVQPGGSIRDDEVIAAANAAGVTMYVTGARHFFH